MADLQNSIQKLLDGIVAEGRELGVQVAAYHRGKLVVDAWAGVADRESRQPVDARTLFPVFSTTKGIAATVAHRLAQRGVYSYEDTIASHWPEFARLGKDRITVRNALSHSTGVPHMNPDITAEALHDWEQSCADYANLAPLYPAGTNIEYHAVAFSWAVCEPLCRATKKTFAQLLQQEVCEPLGLRDLFIGMPASEDARLATLYSEPTQPFTPNAHGAFTVSHCMYPLHTWMNSVGARRCCLPSSNGIASARDIAKHYAALLPGGVDGVELLKSETRSAATTLQNPMGAPVEKLPGRFGLGYQIGGGESLMGKRASSFGHGGYGGSIGFADPEAQFAIGLTKNLYGKNPAHAQIVNAVRDGLGIA